VTWVTIRITPSADRGPGTPRTALTGATEGDVIKFALPTPLETTLSIGEFLESRTIGPFTSYFLPARTLIEFDPRL